MRVTDGVKPDENLSAKRGKGLTFDQWQAGYLYFENEAGAFKNETGREFPFPQGANKADSYSAFLAANNG